MLQVVSHLRRSGYFVGVALTKPFAFEGARKAEQADALVEAMEDVASLVVRVCTCVYVCVCSAEPVLDVLLGWRDAVMALLPPPSAAAFFHTLPPSSDLLLPSATTSLLCPSSSTRL